MTSTRPTPTVRMLAKLAAALTEATEMAHLNFHYQHWPFPDGAWKRCDNLLCRQNKQLAADARALARSLDREAAS